jgi:hypothetical protein
MKINPIKNKKPNMKKIILTLSLVGLLFSTGQAQDTTSTENATKKRLIIRYQDGKWDTTFVDSKRGESKNEFNIDMEIGGNTDDDESSDFRTEMKELRKELKEVKPKKRKIDKSVFLLDIGSNGFMQNGNLGLTGSNMALRTENGLTKSVGWGFTFARSENLIAEKLRLMYGLGFEFNNYRLRDDSILNVRRDTVSFLNANQGLTLNTMHMSWINVPVMLQFSSNPYRKSKSFNLAVGGEFGLRIGNLRTTQRYDLGNDIYQNVSTRGPQNTNPIKASLVARAGYGKTDVFVRYGLTELFRQNVAGNPDATPVMAGISFRL